MKNVWWKLSLLAGVSLMLVGSATSVCSAQETPAGLDERLQRLERRINELAERQEQMMQRQGAPQAPQQPMVPQPGFPQLPQQPMMRQMPSPGLENTGIPMPPTGWRPPLEERVHHDIAGVLRLFVLVCLVCNILLAIWIFTDIRKRGEGAGIFIALALVAGVPAAIIYSLVRLGDKVSVAGKQAV